ARGVAPVDLAGAYRALPAADRAAADVVTNPAAHLPQLDRATASRLIRPSTQLRAFLEQSPEAAATHADILRRLRSGEIKPASVSLARAPLVAVRQVGATKAGQLVRAAVKTPAPKERA